PLKQFVAGVSLALFWAEVFFVGYLLWLRDLRHGRLEPSFEEWLSRYKSGPPPDRVPLSLTGYALAVAACVGVTWVAFQLIVWLGGVVFDVLSGPTDQAPGPETSLAPGLSHAWLLAGILVTFGTLLLPGMWSLCKGAQARLARRSAPQEKEAPRPAPAPADPAPPPEAATAKKAPTPAAGWATAAGWLAGAVVLVGWLVALVLLLGWTPAHGKRLWPLVLTLVGLAVTVASPLTERSCAGKWLW